MCGDLTINFPLTGDRAAFLGIESRRIIFKVSQ
jgi:hypothetical protein